MPHGKISYLEIPARTGEKSAAFYNAIFGWQVRMRGDGEIAFDDSGCVSGTWVKESQNGGRDDPRLHHGRQHCRYVEAD